jgi:carbon storage regulator CsrA
MMLVLSRKPSEFIWIMDRETGKPLVKVCLCEIRGDKVRIGFEAPERFQILRGPEHVSQEGKVV